MGMTLHLAAEAGPDYQVLAGSVAAAVRGGVSWVHVRGDRADAQTVLAACVAIQEVCTAPLAVAERADVAVAAGARALQLPAYGLPVWAARAVAPGLLVGASAHSLDEAKELAAARVDYLTVGPVFRSDRPRDEGLALLRSIVAGVDLPVLAAGGINAVNLSFVAETGCAGVVVQSVILDAEDRRNVAAKLSRRLQGAVPRFAFPAAPPR